MFAMSNVDAASTFSALLRAVRYSCDRRRVARVELEFGNVFNAVEALIASDERQSLPEPVELARSATAKITRHVTNRQSSLLRIGEAAR